MITFKLIFQKNKMILVKKRKIEVQLFGKNWQKPENTQSTDIFSFSFAIYFALYNNVFRILLMCNPSIAMTVYDHVLESLDVYICGKLLCLIHFVKEWRESTSQIHFHSLSIHSHLHFVKKKGLDGLNEHFQSTSNLSHIK